MERVLLTVGLLTITVGALPANLETSPDLALPANIVNSTDNVVSANVVNSQDIGKPVNIVNSEDDAETANLIEALNVAGPANLIDAEDVAGQAHAEKSQHDAGPATMVKSPDGRLTYQAQQMYITQNFNGNAGTFIPRGPGANSSFSFNGMAGLHRKLDYLIAKYHGKSNATDEERSGTDIFKPAEKLFSQLLKQTDMNSGVLLKMTEHMAETINKLVTAQAKDSSSSDGQEVIRSFNETLRELDGKLDEIRRYVRRSGCVGNDTDDEDEISGPTPVDCEEVYQRGKRTSGVYSIRPTGASRTTRVYCEMSDRKWTVLMRRFDGKLDFQRNWQEYKYGFGSAEGEYWIGNDNMYFLTNSRLYDARFTMKKWYSSTEVYSEFTTFSVGSESSKYRLGIDGESRSGTATKDRMKYHNGMPFTTKDRKNNQSSRNCAVTYGGGWWHKSCYYAFFTGPYRYGCKSSRDHKCMTWNHNDPLKAASIKIARKRSP